MPTNMNSYGPYDAGAGANITENFWRLMARWFAPNAVLDGYLSSLLPFGDSTGLQAKVSSGAALVRGAYGEATATTTLGLAAVGGIAGGSERWDRLIVRNDFVNNLMQLDVLTGTASASPSTVRPALTQTTSMWEFLLADVGPLVNTTTTITAAMVLDGRWRMSESGILFYEVLPSGVSSVLLPGAGTLPSQYRDAEITIDARSSVAAASADLTVQFNGDATAANYSWNQIAGNNNAVSSAATISQVPAVARVPGATTSAGLSGTSAVRIAGYSRATFGKTVRAESMSFESGAASGLWNLLRYGNWNSVLAITTILLSLSAGNFVAGSAVRVDLKP